MNDYFSQALEMLRNPHEHADELAWQRVCAGMYAQANQPQTTGTLTEFEKYSVAHIRPVTVTVADGRTFSSDPQPFWKTP
jgi:hypothetical protein